VHIYTEVERREHLHTLVDAIEKLLPELEVDQQSLRHVSAYTQALDKANQLLSCGFIQSELSELSRAVPRLFWLHKDWAPPLEGLPPTEPMWFKRLEPLEGEVQRAAEKLRVVGEY
jgi:phosphoglycerate-specific signal transduction histidine kinase